MSVTGIILLILGILIFILSFLLPEKKSGRTEAAQSINKEQLKEMLEEEVEEAKKHINEIVDETITYSMEKTERSMDRLTNEKMMAVNEYSDTVLQQINKNHQEAVFLYDMLNDKHESLKTTVTEAAKTVTEVKQTVKDVEITAREAELTAKEAGEMAREVQESLLIAEPEIKPEDKTIRDEETTELLPEEEVDFVPIQPKRAEVIKKPKKEETPKQKAERKSKAEKVDLNLASPGREGRANNNERILELHKAGKSNMAIAKELGLGIGEVKLVIDLFEGI